MDPDLQLEPAKGGLFWGQGGLRWHHLGGQKNCIWARLAQQHAGQASLFSLLGSKPGILQPIWPPQKNHRLASCFLKTPLLKGYLVQIVVQQGSEKRVLSLMAVFLKFLFAPIYTKGVWEKTRKGAPLGQEGLLIEKHGSGKIGGQTDWENQACLYIQKGSGKKPERGHPWDKKACL